MIWLEFAIGTIAILISGYHLSRYGDMLAEKTGMGRTLIGVILLATVTSLPELATGLSAAGRFESRRRGRIGYISAALIRRCAQMANA